jgi:hypothetical protein
MEIIIREVTIDLRGADQTHSSKEILIDSPRFLEAVH